jgi:hypothetical protein
VQQIGHIGRFLLGCKLHHERRHVSFVPHMLGSWLGREKARIDKRGGEAGLLHRRHILLLGREQTIRQRSDVFDPRDSDRRLNRIGLGARSVGFAGYSLLERQRSGILTSASCRAKSNDRSDEDRNQPHRRDAT